MKDKIADVLAVLVTAASLVLAAIIINGVIQRW